MAKRFTDTDKWRDEWFGPLSNDDRIVWLYIIDTCDHAGIWKKDMRSLNFNCNTSITEEYLIELLDARLIDMGQYFFIPKFLTYQYPKGLNSRKPAIVSVVNRLIEKGLHIMINESLGNDYLMIKDKDKDKNKDQDKDKDSNTDTVSLRIQEIEPMNELLSDRQWIEQFRMKNRSIKDWEIFFEYLRNKCAIEEIDHDRKKIMARANLLAINWKSEKKEADKLISKQDQILNQILKNEEDRKNGTYTGSDESQ